MNDDECLSVYHLSSILGAPGWQLEACMEKKWCVWFWFVWWRRDVEGNHWTGPFTKLACNGPWVLFKCWNHGRSAAKASNKQTPCCSKGKPGRQTESGTAGCSSGQRNIYIYMFIYIYVYIRLLSSSDPLKHYSDIVSDIPSGSIYYWMYINI